MVLPVTGADSRNLEDVLTHDVETWRYEGVEVVKVLYQKWADYVGVVAMALTKSPSNVV